MDQSTEKLLFWLLGATLTLMVLLANFQLTSLHTRFERMEDNIITLTTRVAVLEVKTAYITAPSGGTAR